MSRKSIDEKKEGRLWAHASRNGRYLIYLRQLDVIFVDVYKECISNPRIQYGDRKSSCEPQGLKEREMELAWQLMLSSQ